MLRCTHPGKARWDWRESAYRLEKTTTSQLLKVVPVRYLQSSPSYVTRSEGRTVYHGCRYLGYHSVAAAYLLQEKTADRMYSTVVEYILAGSHPSQWRRLEGRTLWCYVMSCNALCTVECCAGELKREVWLVVGSWRLAVGGWWAGSAGRWKYCMYVRQE